MAHQESSPAIPANRMAAVAESPPTTRCRIQHATPALDRPYQRAHQQALTTKRLRSARAGSASIRGVALLFDELPDLQFSLDEFAPGV
jgi:hypothetical protein